MSSLFPSSQGKKEMGRSVPLIQEENTSPCLKGFYHVRKQDDNNTIFMTRLFCEGKGMPNSYYFITISVRFSFFS